jgi:putative sigma-54 modulation protein
MEITMRATEFEPGERLKARAREKVAKLERYLPDLDRADVELSLEPTRGVEARRIVQINLILNGRVILRAEQKAADQYAALDAAVDTLKRQLLKYKEMRVDWRHHDPERRRLPGQLEREELREIAETEEPEE